MNCYEQDFFYIVAKRELPKLVEELRRANELKAIELKMRMDMPLGVKDIEDIMKGDER